MNIYSNIVKKGKKTKKFAVLIDPDKISSKKLTEIAEIASKNYVDFFFVGGSLLTNDNLDNTIRTLKDNCNVPVVIFPGSNMQINKNADAILLLSLISSRNPEMLIGKHVIAAPYLKASGLEIISTGYMLIESGKPTAVLYMSNSVPIPADKPDIATCTAMAGEMLGLKMIFMDAGSGAILTVSEKMIAKVKQNISVPLIVGGGIRTPAKAHDLCCAGADIIVVGNAIEENTRLIENIADAINLAC
ncbi:MAG TPA: geranylgeranylglyceryl/heptaprenylglyceryl phosphate synthase [Bacteroidales bacterium]|nr:geranylgeranylglyceryl/heptaprenylglyceryl phosphate synthase [Bacteroidales bacterium]HPS15835.1 geranylgeranylglyceryl/heptaprenylglyceryl phosphate synthase [Bacteroidales bacterium]